VEDVMSRTLASLALAALIAAPALAVGYGFNADYTGAAVPAIGTINITVNPNIVRETSYIEHQFGTNYNYIAPTDADDLVKTLRKDLETQLGKSGRLVAGGTGVLNVTIDQAQPSNPAHTQNGRNANLDFRSRGRGGATVLAELVGADGKPAATFSYRWEESEFDMNQTPRIGWFGAERAFDRFSSSLARDLKSPHPAGHVG
jgi:hypothetical protein